jgi:hypothetical protein
MSDGEANKSVDEDSVPGFTRHTMAIEYVQLGWEVMAIFRRGNTGSFIVVDGIVHSRDDRLEKLAAFVKLEFGGASEAIMIEKYGTQVEVLIPIEGRDGE